ncbi:MAG: CDP-alcohol phosphatidyltransferase family protein [Alphaproteobacteria bacterium]
MNPPNVISLARLLCVPATVWLVLSGRIEAAFWLFLGAGASDAVDGFLAKRFNWKTPLGGFLDPMADKALLVCVFVLLGAKGMLPDWLVALVVLRDVLILGGAAIIMRSGSFTHIRPLWVSKVNTLLQILLAAYVLAEHGFHLADGSITNILVTAVTFSTLVSGFAYLVKWGRRAAGYEGAA